MQMKPSQFATALIAVSFIASPALAQGALRIGQPAPAFTGQDSNGKTIKLSDFKGKIVVLEWTNDGCPYVGKRYRSVPCSSCRRKPGA
jgi:hypothetical protein